MLPQAAMKPLTAHPPVPPLLGFFQAAPSDAACAAGGEDEGEDSLWLVFRWESLKPLGLYMSAPPPPPASGFFVNK